MDPITSKFLTSVASGLTGKLLSAAGSRIAKSFSGPKEKEALQLAVRDGIVALLLTIPTDTEDERNLLDEIFKQFFKDEDTAKALVGLLRGMPPDLDDLPDIFSDLGFVAEKIEGFDFRDALYRRLPGIGGELRGPAADYQTNWGRPQFAPSWWKYAYAISENGFKHHIR